jgi:hypothetical protein
MPDGEVMGTSMVKLHWVRSPVRVLKLPSVHEPETEGRGQLSTTTLLSESVKKAVRVAAPKLTSLLLGNEKSQLAINELTEARLPDEPLVPSSVKVQSSVEVSLLKNPVAEPCPWAP